MGTIYRNGVPFVGSGGAGGVEMTQEEYDLLPTSEKMNGAIYFITDGDVSYPTASQMRYDNTESQIPATTVQGAIDENRIEINDLKNGLTTFNDGGWLVKKYPDGTFTAKKSINTSFGSGTAWSGITGMYYHETDTISVPSFATAIRSVIATVIYAQLNFICGTGSIGTSGISFYVANGVSASSAINLSVEIEGTWS